MGLVASDSVCCAWARDRAKAEHSGAGGGECQCVLFVCVCASDIVIEQSRKVVVHLG
jgi:hypothetical protein